MKQGSASSSGAGSRKIEPRSHKVSVVGVADIGLRHIRTQPNNPHNELSRSTMRNAQRMQSTELYPGKGHMAPSVKLKTYKGGGQQP